MHQVVRSTPFVFSFNDDLAWRAAFTSFTFTHNMYGSNVFDYTNEAKFTNGQLEFLNRRFLQDGTWIITIKATGYPDTIVTVISGL
ncbi:hemoblobin-interacting domain-containing protein [Lysinibacillus sp. FSL W8-0992]|uniref:hemoblobin-interacting domain-containing protein n=1 Tax=Lysinibacillus sp. FSL W8-0992 TaxID=2954643 RepID=UPI004046D089